MYELADDFELPEAPKPKKVKSYQQQAYARLQDNRRASREAQGKDPLSPYERLERETELLAQHSSKSQEHYTPSEIVGPARELMGGIDLDPASNWLAQQEIQAGEYLGWKAPGELVDGLAEPWYGTVFLNPPGGDTAKVRPDVQAYSRSYPLVWWGKLMSEYEAGNVREAIFIAFQLNLWANSQVLPCKSMLDFPFCITNRRVRYLYPQDTHEGLPKPGTEMVTSKSPPGYSAIIYLAPKPKENNSYAWDKRDERDRQFKEKFQHLGKVTL